MTKRQEKQLTFKQARSTNLRKKVEAAIKKHGTYSNERIAKIQKEQKDKRAKYLYSKAWDKYLSKV